MVAFIDELRSDLVDHPKQRDLFVVPNRNVMLNTGGETTLVYYRSEHPELMASIRILENHGYVRDVTDRNVPRYRLSEEFVAHILECD